MTRYDKIKLERARRRAESAHRAWAKLSSFCEARSVQVKMFGSIAEARGDEMSDLDVMVFGDVPEDLTRAIIREAEAVSAAEGVPVDLLFARDFPQLAGAL